MGKTYGDDGMQVNTGVGNYLSFNVIMPVLAFGITITDKTL